MKKASKKANNRLKEILRRFLGRNTKSVLFFHPPQMTWKNIRVYGYYIQIQVTSILDQFIFLEIKAFIIFWLIEVLILLITFCIKS